MFVLFKKLHKKTALLLFFSLNINSFSLGHEEVKKPSVFVHVKDLYSKSLDIGQERTEIVDKKKKLTLQIAEPTLDQMRSIVMDLLVKQPPVCELQTSALDHTFLKKMELFNGGENVKNHLLGVVDNTDTIFGQIMLAAQLAQPTHDSAILKNKQAIVKELLNNSDLFTRIQGQLAIIRAAEPCFISYFQKENAVNEELFKKVYWGDKLGFLNSNEWTLELGVRLGNLGNLCAVSNLPLIFPYISAAFRQAKSQLNQDPISFPSAFGQSAVALVDPRLDVYRDGGFEERKNEVVNVFQKMNEVSEAMGTAYRDHNQEESQRLYKQLSDLQAKEFPLAFLNFVPQTLGDCGYALTNIHGKPKIIVAGFLGGLAALQTYLTYNAFQDAKLKQSIAAHLQTKLIAVASYIKALRGLQELICENPLLASLPGLEALNDLFVGPKLSADAQKLLDLLDCSTFKGEASVFSLTGRILAAHKLMQKVKEEFVPACAAAGKIDAYLSTAKLYAKFQNTPASFCFADFIEKSDKPFVHAVEFWNPFIDAYQVVTNSLELGGDNPCNIILTGPNTGGKSTVIKGLLVNILLAQTLSIAPAKELIMTPFANLNCYLNITDDLAAGTSLFKAEVLRAKALINAVRSLGSNAFSFTIIDEVFSGTSPKEGEEAALMVAQELGGIKNSLCSIATHFPRLTDELSMEHFKNYKVTVYKDEKGNWVRPFTLEEGKSLLNIAMDLLREEGIFA